MRELEVLIVTHNRIETLKTTLASVTRELVRTQLSAPIKILLNGVDDTSRDWLRHFTQQSPNAENEFYESPITLGPSAARNFLAKKALGQAKWQLFLDDDCVLPQDFFVRFQKVLAEMAPQAQIVGGPNLTPPAAPPFEQACGQVLGHGLASLKSAWRYKENNAFFRCTDIELTSTHLFVRNEVLERVQFPVEFQTAEENAFLHRVTAQGFNEIFYFGSLFVYHERRRTLSAFAWQIFRYGRGRGQMVRDGFSFSWFHLAPALMVAVLAGGFFWPRALQLAVFGFLGAAYLMATLFSALQMKQWRAPFLFVTLHGAYVLGWWAGFVLRSSPKTESTLS